MAKRNSSDFGTLTGTYTLTGSYVSKGGVINSSGYDTLSLLIDYTKNTETSLDFKVVFSKTRDFTKEYERIILVTDTGTGISDCLDNTFKRTTSGKFEVPISVRGLYFKVYFKVTGALGTGSITADYNLSNAE